MKVQNNIIQIVDCFVNGIIFFMFFPILVYGIYTMWDSNHIYQQANASIYETYKPTSSDVLSFEELQKNNPEVFGWLMIDNTHIDYPLVQAEDNYKYVNTDVLGKFSLSGSIFLDCNNKKNFSDFNNIIYGHHMEKDTMFGEVEYFSKPSYFEEHSYGKLYYEDQWHKVEFFAFVHADAYDNVLYNTRLKNATAVQMYLDYVKKHAEYFKEVLFNKEERFVTLSTCTSESTNGRHLLIGRIIKDTKNKKGEPQYEKE